MKNVEDKYRASKISFDIAYNDNEQEHRMVKHLIEAIERMIEHHGFTNLGSEGE